VSGKKETKKITTIILVIIVIAFIIVVSAMAIGIAKQRPTNPTGEEQGGKHKGMGKVKHMR
jgi:hypothetical protein